MIIFLKLRILVIKIEIYNKKLKWLNNKLKILKMVKVNQSKSCKLNMIKLNRLLKKPIKKYFLKCIRIYHWENN